MLESELVGQSDAELAKSLQEKYQKENSDLEIYIEQTNPKTGYSISNIVDDSWELVDPNPDIHMLFLTYNKEYFFGKLKGIEVRWSPKMTSCAGLCCYEGHGGLCSVRLSLPLLKLRPRKDLVQTLLHEMIHAYLFVTHNNKDHDAHGAEFHKHMHRINHLAGTKITVYHNFFDEVALYKQHWWRCQGVCKDRKPFYGWVKRAMNRAPSHNDRWWTDHQATCGGLFVKVKEPEKVERKGKKREGSSSQGAPSKRSNTTEDIRKFLSPKDDTAIAGSSSSVDSIFPRNKRPDTSSVDFSRRVRSVNAPINGNKEKTKLKKKKELIFTDSEEEADEVFQSKDKQLDLTGGNVKSPEKETWLKKPGKENQKQPSVRPKENSNPWRMNNIQTIWDTPSSSSSSQGGTKLISNYSNTLTVSDRSIKKSKEEKSSNGTSAKGKITKKFPGKGHILGEATITIDLD